MIAKIHKTENNEVLLSVCDTALLGKKIEEGEKQLDLTSDFYNGEEMSNGEIGDLMRNSYMLNLVGEKSVSLGLKEEVIHEENVKNIAGVPYAQAKTIKE